MSARDVRLRIARLVVHDDGAFSVADLESAIGRAILQRFEARAQLGPRRSVPERIADGVLDHPRVATSLARNGR